MANKKELGNGIIDMVKDCIDSLTKKRMGKDKKKDKDWMDSPRFKKAKELMKENDKKKKSTILGVRG